MAKIFDNRGTIILLDKIDSVGMIVGEINNQYFDIRTGSGEVHSVCQAYYVSGPALTRMPLSELELIRKTLIGRICNY